MKIGARFLTGCSGLLLCLANALAPLPAGAADSSPADPVTSAEIGEIRRALQSLGLRHADVVKGDDGRAELTGEYEDRDAVEAAFAASRAVVGLRRVAPTTPSNIKYRLKGFDSAFASTVGKMMKRAESPAPAPASATQTEAPAAARDERAAGNAGPRTFGLIIGVGQFKNLPADKGLEYADKDARDFYNLMTTSAGGTAAGSIRLLTHAEATSTTVKTEMRKIVDQAQSGDTVVFFAASHGLPNAMNKFDIVLYDTEFPRRKAGAKDDALDIVITNRKTALSDDDLQGFVAQLTLNNVRTVMVLDTCYSGKTFVAIPGYLPSRTRSLSRYKKEVDYVASPSQSAIQDLVQKTKDSRSSRIVIVSASENEESMESPKLGGGAFTQLYISELNKAHDFADAFDQTKTAVVRTARTMGHSQTPRMLVVPEEANTRM